ncbi:hypothetical protein DFH94DRAFT_279179 [Russula ochroleuca]|jgi:hypothetical protein|uniref:Uncharacterized protein n=1 Tax=Russula ochroleuca TaxID=152965 RepID=A0A9P5JWU5_9AGAM|nr:hypothetical protein DFH94DRAFT_279179 [Russula ochroleuca]
MLFRLFVCRAVLIGPRSFCEKSLIIYYKWRTTRNHEGSYPPRVVISAAEDPEFHAIIMSFDAYVVGIEWKVVTETGWAPNFVPTGSTRRCESEPYDTYCDDDYEKT